MKDPAFLFYSSDFLTGTMTMDNEQVGKYIRLLCLQHHKKRISEKDMLKICLTKDEDIYSKFKKDEVGYFNERMEIEMKKRAEYSESRRNNRKGKTKKENNICKSYDKHMENENININIDVIKEYYIEQISNFQGGVKIKEYEKLVNFLFGENKEKLIFKNVLKMEEQLSYSHFEVLIKQHKLPDITAKIRKMENYDQLYKSKGVYLTLNNWMV